MNISIEYMYRDGANYKQYSILVFSNTTDLSIEWIKRQINLYLLDGEYFIPRQWGLPNLQKFEYDPELDHEFHEIVDMKYSNETPEVEKDIFDLLQEINSTLN